MNAFVQPPRDVSVFINCPFSSDYGPSLDAIIFTVLYCGFTPRSALETEGVSKPRMHRIASSLLSSHYSIHDLSRIYGEGRARTARLNMPLELGMAVQLTLLDDDKNGPNAHDWAALVISGAEHNRAISDLKGFDLKEYAKREDLVPLVVSWLVTRPHCPRPSSEPEHVVQLLDKFDGKLSDLRKRWTHYLPWTHVLRSGREIVDGSGVHPQP